MDVLKDGQATVHENVRPSHVAPCFTGEQDDGPSQLLRLTHTPKRIPLRPGAPVLFEACSLIQYGVHIARAYAVDANAISCPLRRHRTLHGEYGTLGRVVVDLRLREIRAVGRYACHQDDAAAVATVLHGFRHGLRAEKRAGSIDLEHLSPFLGAYVQSVNGTVDAREAKKGVNGAKRALHVRNGLGDCVGVGDVDLSERKFSVGKFGFEFADGSLGFVRVKVEDDQAANAVLEQRSTGD